MTLINIEYCVHVALFALNGKLILENKNLHLFYFTPPTTYCLIYYKSDCSGSEYSCS